MACAGAGGGRASGVEAALDEVGLPEVGVEVSAEVPEDTASPITT
jgi:hypothetical protein